MLQGKDWLDDHLEGFVKPLLGYVPDVPLKAPLSTGYDYVALFNEPLMEALWLYWQRAKIVSKGRDILLPGRDVYLFEILARVEGYPTLYHQELSSTVSTEMERQIRLKIIPDHKWYDCFLVDSGSSGSIARKLGIKDFGLVSGSKPLLPTNANAGTLYGYLEGAPKYYECATPLREENVTMVNGTPVRKAIEPLVIVQELALPRPAFRVIGCNTPHWYVPGFPSDGPRQFINAARLTQHLSNFVLTKIKAPTKRGFAFMEGRFL